MSRKSKILPFAFCILISPISGVYAHGGAASAEGALTASGKTPSVFAVLQQQGPVCPYLPFYNLNIVKDLRNQGGGDIDFDSAEYYGKLKGYAKFLPHIRALDDAYDRLRKANGPYKSYEDDIRANGIKNTDRKTAKGKDISTLDWYPTNKARRENYTPYNINTNNGLGYCDRLLPIFHKSNKVFFYNHKTNQTSEIKAAEAADTGRKVWLYTFDNDKSDDVSSTPRQYLITDEMETLMGGALDASRIHVAKNRFGATTSYLYTCSENQLYQDEMFYDIGTYQHMLFALGLDRNNNDFTSQSPEWAAYQEFKAEMDKNPLNPWYQIDKNDLIEYQIAELFKTDPALKARAIQAVEFYNSPWKFYQEAMTKVFSKGQALGQKTQYLPGDDQMLAYFFTAQLRFLWAATEGMDAVIEIEELEEELGKTTTNVLKAAQFLPGIPTPQDIIKHAVKRQYKDQGGSFNFVDVWLQIKKDLQQKLGDKLDFVTFTGHGCLISIDDDLVESQPHEYKEVARVLGIEMWEQHYDQGFTGLHYQKKGTAADVIKFE